MTTKPATMIRPAPRPLTARPARNAPTPWAAPQVRQPAPKRSCPAYSEGSGPERLHDTPARTIPSSWAVSITEKASP